jgi:Clp amino terminal domain, pathogenicity island component
MFERFTERARRVVVLAQEQALMLGHSQIGTEHLLLGVLAEREGVAGQVLASLGVDAESVRAQVVASSGSANRSAGAERSGPRQIPFMPEAKKTLDGALREAIGLGHNYIGTEHLLLGLVRQPDGMATRLLARRLGRDAPDTIRGEVMRMLVGHSGSVSLQARDLDRSWFDFTPAEAYELASRLAPLSSRITFEVRPHGQQEPTFRVSARLAGNDDLLRKLVELEQVGIRAILDNDRSVRLGRIVAPGQETVEASAGESVDAAAGGDANGAPADAADRPHAR